MTPARCLTFAAALTLAACASQQQHLPRLTPADERIFHADPRWLGGDAAVSIDLGGSRILWLFGDSFIDEAPPYTRTDAAFARNSIAVETGTDPATATMDFTWRHTSDGTPASYFPEAAKDWYWPGSGLILPDGTLAIFLHRLRATADAPPLGFESAGYALALIANPEEPPAAWRGRIVPGPGLPFDALPGAAMIRDGDAVTVLATRTIGPPAGMLARFDAKAMAAGDLSSPLWWNGADWQPARALGVQGPAVVIDDAGAESSLHTSVCGFVHVASAGFGATIIVARTAPALTGPWSAPVTLLRPPESNVPGAFVYAGRAHTALGAPPDTLRISYVPSSLNADDLLAGEGASRLYWPRMAVAAAPGCLAGSGP